METEWMNETSAETPSAPETEKPEKKKFSLKGFGGKKKKRWLKILIALVVVAAIVVGCVSPIDVVWDVADTFNGLMAVPNFVAIFALSGVVAKLTKEHFDNAESKLRK